MRNGRGVEGSSNAPMFNIETVILLNTPKGAVEKKKKKRRNFHQMKKKKRNTLRKSVGKDRRFKVQCDEGFSYPQF